MGSSVAAHAIPVQTTGATDVVTVTVQKASAQGVSSGANAGLASFNSANFTVDANGYVTFSGGSATETLTGNSGGAVGPTANNINTVGTGSITIVGNPGTSTLTTQLTGLTNHSVQVGAGTATLTQLAVGTNGQVLIGATGADPAFATLTSSDNSISFTTGANTLSLQVAGGSTSIKTITGNTGGPESPSGGNFNIVGTGSITVAGSANTETVQLTGLTNHSLLVGAGTATITNLGVATNGQLPIGSTGADPVLATITAGTGISVTNGAGSITIASTGSPMTWTDEGTNFNAVAGNGYFITAAAVATLPASPSQGNTISFALDTASALTITANTGQVIRIGSVASAAAGTAVSNSIGDSVTLVYRSSDTTWIATSVIGTWTVT